MTYLDELFLRPDPTAKATRVETKERCESEWVKYGNFELSQQRAWQLWDAVSRLLVIKAQ